MTAIRATLPVEELELLRELALGARNLRSPIERGETLVRGGFARVRGGALTITTKGYAKLVLEITRTSWLSRPR